MKFACRGNFIFFLFFPVLGLLLAGPAGGGGMPDSGPPFTDYGYFLGELRAAGALKFYDNTEELLRLAQFERALMRYRFLQGHIQKKVDYRGLKEMVDLRLRFLKKQMRLQERDIAAIPPRKARIPRIKPPETKATQKKESAARPKTPGAAAKDKNKEKAALTDPGKAPPVYAITGPPAKAARPPGTAAPPVTGAPPATATSSPSAAPPVTAAQKPPDVVTGDANAKEEKAEEEKEEAKPPKPLSVWEKLKIRLHLKK